MQLGWNFRREILLAGFQAGGGGIVHTCAGNFCTVNYCTASEVIYATKPVPCSSSAMQIVDLAKKREKKLLIVLQTANIIIYVWFF